MSCSRCQRDAVVKRGDVFLCGKCAIAADWQGIIASIQDARVETPVAGQGVARSA